MKVPVHVITISVIVIVFSWLMIERAVAEPEQKIILIELDAVYCI